MNNLSRVVLFAILIFLVVAVVVRVYFKFRQDPVYTYNESKEHFYNPLMGFAPQGSYKAAVADNTLVYVEVLWRDFEPEEGVYDFEAINQKSNVDLWRSQGKHGVLRFICDIPTDEQHKDIPDWLFEKIGGDGMLYKASHHMGFSPNYANSLFIAYHKKAIEKLAEYANRDTFISYVQFGSLGHYGEWHVVYADDPYKMPPSDIREQYVRHYVDSFKNVKFLMRRPFNHAEKFGFGLFDDMAGHKEATEEWLSWIQNGGDYNGEKKALSPMPDAWKKAPIGGEFNSAVSFDWMLRFNIDQTLDLLKRSHTTFLGPKTPFNLSEDCNSGIDAVLKTIGYRISISEAAISPIRSNQNIRVKLNWVNNGIAPLYWDWPVHLYMLSETGDIISKTPVDIKLSKLIPDQTIVSQTEIAFSEAHLKAKKLCLGITDPMTNRPAVKLTMQAERIDNMSVLKDFSND